MNINSKELKGFKVKRALLNLKKNLILPELIIKHKNGIKMFKNQYHRHQQHNDTQAPIKKDLKEEEKI